MYSTSFNPSPDPIDESAARAWLRALHLTAPIEREPETTLFTLIERMAETYPEAPALLSTAECISYRDLTESCNRYARWAKANGLGRGSTACLLMPNRPEYVAAWLGITSTGCAVALLNTRLTGSSLAHSITTVKPSHIIVASELLENLRSTHSLSGMTAAVVVCGPVRGTFRNIADEMDALSGAKLNADERTPATGGPLTTRDSALYICTSGTTGLPKAVKISHGRIVQWSLWFAGMMRASREDRLYNCLPMYHSVGGIVAVGAMLVAGGSVVIRQEFSASLFWSEIVHWDCTLFQYIGELCRYLLQAPPVPDEKRHRLRMCIGNGLRPDIWSRFKCRFEIPRILEFYAATEGSVFLFNVEGKPGALGRIPDFLAHRRPIVLVKHDERTGHLVRNNQNRCVPSAPDEIGEAIAPLRSAPGGNAFEGYTSAEETEKKIARDVFEPGDAWFRTGDLMRCDTHGYFYFVDRVGDSFRWKGENVSGSEVEQVICSFPGVRQASVYGVAVPHTDGRAGMAGVVTATELSLTELYAHLVQHLPDFARPVFLRLCLDIETTGTFRNVKERLAIAGYDPSLSSDAIYFNDRRNGAFVPLTGDLFDSIQGGRTML